MSNPSVLDVNLHGEKIGGLINTGGDRTIFTFTDDYIENNDRPTLGLGFKDDTGSLRTKFHQYQTRVMPFFSNLLPEGHLRKYLSALANVKEDREFHLLRALGRDLAGAVTITPFDGESRISDPDEFNQDGHGGLGKPGSQSQMMNFSLAGVQLKFSAVAEASGGLTIPTCGVGGSWIVKLPSREFEAVPENEFSMMKIAEYIGMDVPTIDLISVDTIGNLPEGIGRIEGKAFTIKRFDRLSGGAKAHIEDFAQVYGIYPDDKYGKGNFRSIARVIATECGEEDIVEYIKRLTFNMLIGNADMHMKNWSLIYYNKRRPSLAPAYDFLSTVPYIPGDDTNMKISRTKAFSEFTLDELTHLAVKAAIPKKMAIDAAKETASLFRDHWRREASNLPMSNGVRTAVSSHMERVPILRELLISHASTGPRHGIRTPTAIRSTLVVAGADTATAVIAGVGGAIISGDY